MPITKVGPKFYTCQGCFSRVADADACREESDGRVLRIHVCDRCRPAETEGFWLEVYEPECPMCGGAHTPYCR